MYLASLFRFSGPDLLASLLFYFLLFLLPVAIFAVVVHLVFSIPFRRKERARFFVDLLETALKQNHSVEHVILSAAESHDHSLGVRFYIVAAHIESDRRLGEALAMVPRFLPQQISAMLRAGEKLGNLKSVLPACRETLRNSPTAVSSAIHYMIGLLLIFSPIAIWIISVLNVWVVPQFRSVTEDMDFELWPVSRFVFAMIPLFVDLEVVLFFIILVSVMVYVGGQGFVRWFKFKEMPLVDWITWRVPWKRKRLQRAFSAMLAVLLDGGVPEAEAVGLAGDCTSNAICTVRARKVVASMEHGAKLVDAVKLFDDTGEFQWRLANAIHAKGGFLHALRGWHESLDAKAFQQEEATAHLVTSGLVIFNGLLVGLIAVGMFGILIAIIDGALAW